MTIWIAAVLVALIGGVGFRLWYRRWHPGRAAGHRVTEKPNSYYSSERVRALEDRERWAAIDLRRLHPLNQEEVVRLLKMVDRDGTGALSPADRLFLDNMTVLRLD